MLRVMRGVLRGCRTVGFDRRRPMLLSAASSPSQAAVPSAAQLADDAAHSAVSSAAEPSVIDESLFDKTLNLLALRVPAALCSRIMAALRPTSLLFTHSKLPTIVDDEQPAIQPPLQHHESGNEASRAGSSRPRSKLVLLSPSLSSTSAFPSPLAALVAEHRLSTAQHSVQLSYQMHSLDEVLSAVLPVGVPPPSSFETVGHLAHVNLLPGHLPYRRLIGAAIVSHSPGIRCVVNKLSAISDEYRVLPMEVIAGDEHDTLTVVREHGCQFRFDYRLVYWNSRLATEHRRLVDLIQPHETVVDMFAGIGPFVIPIAKKHTGDGQQLLANDKNVHSFDALNANIQLNGVTGKMRTFNLDARHFIALVTAEIRAARLTRVDHVIMNLPATAISFLDCLRGIYAHDAPPPTEQQEQRVDEERAGHGRVDGHESEQRQPTASTAATRGMAPACPVVHVYCFSSADDKVADVMGRIETVIQHPLPLPTLSTDMRRSHGHGSSRPAAVEAGTGPAAGSVRPSAAVDRKRKREEKQHAALLLAQPASWDKPLVHLVRNVAPNKDMLCVSFRLPEQVAFDSVHTAG